MRKWEHGPPIEVLRQFCQLYRTVAASVNQDNKISLQEAARRMKTSAGALSASLKELEQYYGLQPGMLLIRRDVGGCQLTDFSKNLFQRGMRCVESHDALRGWTEVLPTGCLRIGSPLVVNNYIIPEVLNRCTATWNATVDIDYRDEETFLGRIGHLRLEKYSLVVDVLDEHGFEGIDCEPLVGFESIPWLIVPPKSKPTDDSFHALRSKGPKGYPHPSRKVSLAELAGYPLALSDNPAVLSRLPQPDRTEGYRISSNSTIPVLHLVQKGGCIGIVYAWRSLLMGWLDEHPGLEAFSFEDGNATKPSLPRYKFGIYTRRNRSLHDFERAFVTNLKTFAKEGCPYPLRPRR